VVNVSWNDAVAYAKWIGKRLPTEAEWEYAARGGLVGKKYPQGDSINLKQANYNSFPDYTQNSSKQRGSYTPNKFGLFDMSGNVSEWCSDWYDQGYYGVSGSEAPKGPQKGRLRVFRGGSWADCKENLTVTRRERYYPQVSFPYVGFRCARDHP